MSTHCEVGRTLGQVSVGLERQLVVRRVASRERPPAYGLDRPYCSAGPEGGLTPHQCVSGPLLQLCAGPEPNAVQPLALYARLNRPLASAAVVNELGHRVQHVPAGLPMVGLVRRSLGRSLWRVGTNGVSLEARIGILLIAGNVAPGGRRVEEAPAGHRPVPSTGPRCQEAKASCGG